MNLVDTPYVLEEKEKQITNVLKEDFDMLNIQLRAGEEVKEHHANANVLIVVRRGKVQFTVEGTEHVVTTENILHMKPLEKHSLKALEDSDIVVTKISL
ncbi:AraC family ligand binding domain-containing protein [Psychrobacillus sp. FSL K6-2836]|uniref:AraC family ligand binding domain-containing protein n=1 Tax=Psychrobacillus sp. FSL K6-2836 TaxID=2921548 RepID=UPI0030FD1F90